MRGPEGLHTTQGLGSTPGRLGQALGREDSPLRRWCLEVCTTGAGVSLQIPISVHGWKLLEKLGTLTGLSRSERKVLGESLDLRPTWKEILTKGIHLQGQTVSSGNLRLGKSVQQSILTGK